jgi:hypothetical protein
MTEARTPVWYRMSRSTRFVVALGAVLLLLAVTGVMQADRGVTVSSEEAVAAALEVVDFEPENVQVRLIRQGISLRPVWGVSLSIPVPGTNDFEQLTTVEVDAADGTVLRVVTSE